MEDVVEKFQALGREERRVALGGLLQNLDKYEWGALRDILRQRKFQCDMIGSREMPLELVMIVFSHLEFYDVFRLQNVSKAWYRLLSSPKLVDYLLRHLHSNAPAKDSDESLENETMHKPYLELEPSEDDPSKKQPVQEYPRNVFHSWSPSVVDQLLRRWYTTSHPPPLMRDHPGESLIDVLLVHWYTYHAQPLLCEVRTPSQGDKYDLRQKRVEHLQRFCAGIPHSEAVFKFQPGVEAAPNAILKWAFQTDIMAWVTREQSKLGVINVRNGRTAELIIPGRQAVQRLYMFSEYLICTTLSGNAHAFKLDESLVKLVTFSSIKLAAIPRCVGGDRHIVAFVFPATSKKEHECEVVLWDLALDSTSSLSLNFHLPKFHGEYPLLDVDCVVPGAVIVDAPNQCITLFALSPDEGILAQISFRGDQKSTFFGHILRKWNKHGEYKHRFEIGPAEPTNWKGHFRVPITLRTTDGKLKKLKWIWVDLLRQQFSFKSKRFDEDARPLHSYHLLPNSLQWNGITYTFRDKKASSCRTHSFEVLSRDTDCVSPVRIGKDLNTILYRLNNWQGRISSTMLGNDRYVILLTHHYAIILYFDPDAIVPTHRTIPSGFVTLEHRMTTVEDNSDVLHRLEPGLWKTGYAGAEVGRGL